MDASIVEASRQRNSRDENAHIKSGEPPPQQWPEAKRRQKDTQARWTKKHGRSRYGDKNHLSVDHQHKLIRSQVFEELLDPSNTRAEVWADSAYRSAKIEAYLTGAGYRSRIHRKGARGKPLSARVKIGLQNLVYNMRRFVWLAGSVGALAANRRTAGMKWDENSVGLPNSCPVELESPPPEPS